MSSRTVITIFSILASLIAIPSLLILLIVVYAYIQPIIIPRQITDKLQNELTKIMPYATDVKLAGTSVVFDKNLKLSFHNISIKNLENFEFDIPTVNVSINFFKSLIDYNERLIKVEVINPKIFNHSEDNIQFLHLPSAIINEYINYHRKILLKSELIIKEIDVNSLFKNNNISDFYSSLILNEINIKPIMTDNLVLSIIGDFITFDVKNTINAVMDFSSNKYLVIKGNITNPTSNILKSLDLKIPQLNNAEFDLNVEFKAILKSVGIIDYIEYSISSQNGIIRQNDFFEHEFNFIKFKLAGYCFKNCSEITLEKLNFLNDDVNLTSNFEIINTDDSKLIKAIFSIDTTSSNNISKYWPKSIAGDLRQWIIEHIKDGSVKANGVAKFDLLQVSTKQEPEIDVNIEFNDSSLCYNANLPPITNINALLKISSQGLNFDIGSAMLSNINLQNIKGSIDNLFNTNVSSLKLESDFSGEATVLSNTLFNYFGVNDIAIKKGSFSGIIRANLPVHKDVDLNQLDIKGTLNLKDVEIENLSNDHLKPIEGVFTIDLKDQILSSNAKIDIGKKLKGIIAAKYYLKTEDYTFNIVSIIDWHLIDEMFSLKPEFLSGKSAITFESESIKSVKKQILNFDLKDSTINFTQLNLKKAAGIAGTLNIDLINLVSFLQKKNLVIDDFKLNLPNIVSHGKITLDNKLKIISIDSKFNTIGRGNFGFVLNNTENTTSLIISGDSVDLDGIEFKVKKPDLKLADSIHLDEIKSTTTYTVESKLKKLYLNNNKYISNPQIKMIISDNMLKKFDVQGKLNNESSINLDFNYPHLSLITTDSESLLSGLGITKKIKSGMLRVQGSFNEKLFNGTLEITNFRMMKIPIIAKLISIISITTTSFESLLNLFTNTGIKFDILKCPLSYENGILVLNDCYVTGPTLAITATGKIDFDKDAIEIKGSVIPENILNMIARNIPIFGNIFKNKKDHALIGASYKIDGSVKDPSISSNPLSVLAPGFLKEVFR